MSKSKSSYARARLTNGYWNEEEPIVMVTPQHAMSNAAVDELRRWLTEPPIKREDAVRTNVAEDPRAHALGVPVARELQASEAEYRDAVYTAAAETRENNVLAALRAHAAGGTCASEWHDAYEVYLALVHQKREARRKRQGDDDA